MFKLCSLDRQEGTQENIIRLIMRLETQYAVAVHIGCTFNTGWQVKKHCYTDPKSAREVFLAPKITSYAHMGLIITIYGQKSIFVGHRCVFYVLHHVLCVLCACTCSAMVCVQAFLSCSVISIFCIFFIFSKKALWFWRTKLSKNTPKIHPRSPKSWNLVESAA